MRFVGTRRARQPAMNARRLLGAPCALIVAGVAAFSGSSGCSDGASDAQAAVDTDEPSVGESSSALVAGDPVSKAVSESCSTTAVKGLGTQLVGEIQCLRPNTLARIDAVPNTVLGAAVFPYLQSPAAAALAKAAKTRGVKLTINSALRTLPQQYLLYRWYQTGRCGIGLAARPGTSNHESGVAVDVNDNAGWRTGFQSNGFRWLGASDPVHYDYVSGGANLRGLSVKAFQRLWNRNHPTDKIPEDGVYGASTESRLARSPVGGFPIGPSCPDGGVVDAGTDASRPDAAIPEEPPSEEPGEVPVEPDAPEPDSLPEDSPAAGEPSPRAGLPTLGPNEGRGCSSTGAPLVGEGGLLVALALVSVALRSRRRARRDRGGHD